MTAISNYTTFSSAPGKVLVAGGYLVLDRSHRGWVIATDSRFYSELTSQYNDENLSGSSFEINLQSPQFLESTRKYEVEIDEITGLITLHHGSGLDNSPNPFIDNSLFYALSLVQFLCQPRWPNNIAIKVFADNDFYSQSAQLEKRNLPHNSEGLKSLPKFCCTDGTLKQVHKTGLGSSAALVTSLVAGILSHFNALPDNITSESTEWTESLHIVHNLSQIVHCKCQGKIGSGFDISSAVWGSHMYRRFSPDILSGFFDHDKTRALFDPQKLWNIVDRHKTAWDSEASCFNLPNGLNLVLSDVHGGSNTPKMVGQILKWKRENPNISLPLWTKLDELNSRFGELLQDKSFSMEDSILYNQVLKACSQLAFDEWHDQISPNLRDTATFRNLCSLRHVFQEIRENLRSISNLANVPVEPKEQSALIDECLKLPGVLLGGVPGAGGYDALFFIVLDNSCIKSLEECWQNWPHAKVSPLLSRESLSQGLVIERSLNRNCGL